MNLLPSRILITGGAGFMGSTLVRQCLQHEQVQVANLDKFTYAGQQLSVAALENNPRHTLHKADIANTQAVRSILTESQPQAVFHLAAETHVDRSIVQPSTFADTNVLGTCLLLEEITHYWQSLPASEQQDFRFLYVSTDEVFGSADGDFVFDEQSPLAPNSPYAASKAAAGHFVRAFTQTFGLPTLFANPSNNYGQRQHPEKLIPKMILAAVQEKQLTLYGDGLHQRDWLHVDDCCRALIAILLHGDPGDVFAVGCGQGIPNMHVVEMICDLVSEFMDDDKERRSLILHIADRLGHDRRYAVSSNTLQEKTGWQPNIDFAEGLRSTVEWYLSHAEWVEETAESNA